MSVQVSQEGATKLGLSVQSHWGGAAVSEQGGSGQGEPSAPAAALTPGKGEGKEGRLGGKGLRLQCILGKSGAGPRESWSRSCCERIPAPHWKGPAQAPLHALSLEGAAWGSVISAQMRCGFSSRHSQPCCPHGPEARMSLDWTVHPSTAGSAPCSAGPSSSGRYPCCPSTSQGHNWYSSLRTPSSVPSLSCHLSTSWRLTQGYDPNPHSRGGLSPRPSYPPQPGLLHMPFATKGEDAPVVTCALHTSLLPSPLCDSRPTRSCQSEQLHQEGLLLGTDGREALLSSPGSLDLYIFLLGTQHPRGAFPGPATELARLLAFRQAAV